MYRSGDMCTTCVRWVLSSLISLENFKINHLNVHTIIAHHKNHDDVVVFFCFCIFSLIAFCCGSWSRLLTVSLSVEMFEWKNLKKNGENINVIGVWHVNKNDDVAANIFPFIGLLICRFFPICPVSLSEVRYFFSWIMGAYTPKNERWKIMRLSAVWRSKC